MDLTDRLIDHDAWMTRRLLERALELSDSKLDARLAEAEQPMPFEPPQSTLRSQLERMVATKETWIAAVNGEQVNEERDTSIPGLLKRHDRSAVKFVELVRDVRDEGNWDSIFVDESCSPPERFTFGGMIAHVISFNAYRRIAVLKTMEKLGLTGLGYGDPIEWEREREL